MKNMNKIKLMVTLISTALSVAGTQHAYALDSDHYTGDAYLVDSTKKVVRDQFGNCVRTGSWKPENIIQGCGAPAPDTMEMPEVTPPNERIVDTGPEQPLFEKVNLSAETVFDFNKSTLRPHAKVPLDELVEKLQAYPEVELVLVTGHTDRIGSDKYNQALSERRAASVKTYLVSKGVAEERIQVEGKGKTEPVTGPNACKGLKHKKLHACLQPDRRVVVEIGVQKAVSKKTVIE